MDRAGLTKKLVESGMSKAEAEVYVLLLSQPSMTAPEITKETGLPRSTVVVALEKLTRLNVIDEYTQGKRRSFVVRSPQEISKYVEAEKRELEVKQASLSRLVSELDQFHFLRSVKGFEVETLQGEEGFKELYQRTLKLKKGEEILRISVEAEKFVFFPAFLKEYSKEKNKKGIYTRLLIPESPLGKIARQRDKEDMRETRFLSKAMYDPRASIVVWGDYVSLTTWDQNLETLVIKSKALVDIFRSVFEVCWKNAKK